MLKAASVSREQAAQLLLVAKQRETDPVTLVENWLARRIMAQGARGAVLP